MKLIDREITLMIDMPEAIAPANIMQVFTDDPSFSPEDPVIHLVNVDGVKPTYCPAPPQQPTPGHKRHFVKLKLTCNAAYTESEENVDA